MLSKWFDLLKKRNAKELQVYLNFFCDFQGGGKGISINWLSDAHHNLKRRRSITALFILAITSTVAFEARDSLGCVPHEIILNVNEDCEQRTYNPTTIPTTGLILCVCLVTEYR